MKFYKIIILCKNINNKIPNIQVKKENVDQDRTETEKSL